MKIKSLFKFLVVLVCLATTTLNAQVFPEIGPDNVDDVISEVYEIHGSRIDMPYFVVRDFIASMLPASVTSPEYNPFCTPPFEPKVDSYAGTTIHLEWSENPSAENTRAGYIKLSDTNAATEANSATTTNEYISFNATDGLAIFFFQTFCSATTKGKLNIIIIDKPVYMESTVEDCNCTLPTNTQSASFSGGSSTSNDIVTLPFTHDGHTGVYSIEFEFQTNQHNAKTVFSITEDGNYIIVGVAEACVQNVAYDLLGSVMYPHEEIYQDGWTINQLLGALTFNGQFEFDPANQVNGVITIEQCAADDGSNVGGGSGGRSESGNMSERNSPDKNLFVVPNPASDYLEVNLPQLNTGEEYTFEVISIDGQRTPLIARNQSSQTLFFDIEFLPSGNYTIMAKSNYNSLTSRFVKVK